MVEVPLVEVPVNEEILSKQIKTVDTALVLFTVAICFDPNGPPSGYYSEPDDGPLGSKYIATIKSTRVSCVSGLHLSV